MVLPPEGEAAPRLTRVSRDAEGRFIGFRDPVTGRFVSKKDALPSLRMNIDRGIIQDSFGNRVDPGSLGIPKRGIVHDFGTGEFRYRPGPLDPTKIDPRSDQDIIERLTLHDQKGNLYTVEASSGLGNKYRPEFTGGWFRAKTAEALGLPEDARLPTKDLKKAVVHREIIIRTIRARP